MRIAKRVPGVKWLSSLLTQKLKDADPVVLEGRHAKREDTIGQSEEDRIIKKQDPL